MESFHKNTKTNSEKSPKSSADEMQGACMLKDQPLKKTGTLLSPEWLVSLQRFASDSTSQEFRRDTIRPRCASWTHESQREMYHINRSVRLPLFRHFQDRFLSTNKIINTLVSQGCSHRMIRIRVRIAAASRDI